jgi:hypothetical protein
VTLPYRTKLPPGATTATLWMDLWVKRDARVERIKVEPQLYLQEHWYTYPMEVRIVQPVVPNTPITRGRKPAEGARADAAVRELAREQLCGATPGLGGSEPSIWQMTRRNALQDLELAGADGFSAAVVKAAGARSAADWCAKPASGATNPEWYLRARDAIYRLAGAE